jgi:hypothetical protein
MDFGKAFTFVFEDEEWIKKIGLAGLISLIPIIGWFFLIGWGFKVTRRVIAGDPNPLPDWSELGDFLVKGLLVSVVAFVYSLPVIVIQGCSASLIPLFGSGDQEVLVTIISIFTACVSCFSVLYGIVMGLVLPAAIGNYAAKDEFGAAFRFGEVFRLVRKDLGAYIIVLLGSIVASLVASLGVIACVIGVLFTSAYALVVNGHLIGQAYNRAASSVLPEEEAVPSE